MYHIQTLLRSLISTVDDTPAARVSFCIVMKLVCFKILRLYICVKQHEFKWLLSVNSTEVLLTHVAMIHLIVLAKRECYISELFDMKTFYVSTCQIRLCTFWPTKCCAFYNGEVPSVAVQN
jgi:hypothetical protein